ncbi:MAG: hypothetical protein ACLRWP_15120 [Bilophila wadsworthia]
METLIQALKAINDVIWGPGMLILLIGTGLFLTVGLRFYTFRNIFQRFPCSGRAGPPRLATRAS